LVVFVDIFDPQLVGKIDTENQNHLIIKFSGNANPLGRLGE